MQDIVWGFICGYISSTFVFLVLSLFVRPFKNRVARYLNIANGLLLILLCINLFFWVKETAWPFFSPEKNEYSRHIRNVYSYIYLLAVPVLGFLFQLLFLKKRFRIKKWATVVSVTMLSVLAGLEYILIAVTQNHYNNYIPGSWAYYEATYSEKLVAAGFAIVYFFICWVLSRPKAKMTSQSTAYNF